MVSPACTGTVTRPPRSGCLSWTCEPFWTTTAQPSRVSAWTTSRPVIRGSGGSGGTSPTVGGTCDTEEGGRGDGHPPFARLSSFLPSPPHCRLGGRPGFARAGLTAVWSLAVRISSIAGAGHAHGCRGCHTCSVQCCHGITGVQGMRPSVRAVEPPPAVPGVPGKGRVRLWPAGTGEVRHLRHLPQ
jgi:hypothetical protein